VLQFLSVLVALAGLEMVTGVGTTALRRLQTHFMAAFAGVPTSISLLRIRLGFVILAVGTLGALALWLLGIAARRVQSSGKVCPECGALTKRIRRRPTHRLLAVLLTQQIVRRRCDFCGWVGLSFRR
jgi:hypothetical protein